jgi:hypothetical protein
MTGILRMSMIEAHVGVKAIIDCMATEKAKHIMLARICCRQERPSATNDKSSERILSAAEKSQTEMPPNSHFPFAFSLDHFNGSPIM